MNLENILPMPREVAHYLALIFRPKFAMRTRLKYVVDGLNSQQSWMAEVAATAGRSR